MTDTSASYICRYCRTRSDGSGMACPGCGAPVNVRERVSKSGWEEQPPIADMARIHFGHSTCQIEGKYVPVADMNLHEDDWVYFSHHVILWSDPSIRMGNMPMKGAFKRMLGGMPVVMVAAQGPGHIAFSADRPGETIALPIRPGQAYDVHEHRFLVATGAVGFTPEPTNVWIQVGSGNETETEYPLGMYMDRFYAPPDQNGLLLIHAEGNTFVRDLAPGEEVYIQPSALLYKDASLQMSLHVEYPHANNNNYGFSFGNSSYQQRTVWLRLTGPGRVAMQSVFEAEFGSQYIQNSSWMTTQSW